MAVEVKYTTTDGTVVAVIVWQLDLQLRMQSVPIITDVVSSNPSQGEVYNIMWYRLSVTCGRTGVFSGYSGFLHWPPRYNWNIVESGVKNHKTNQTTTAY